MNEKQIIASIYENLSDEQKKKAKACKSIEEFAEFAGEEGIELPDDALDLIAGGLHDGGGCWDPSSHC